MSVNKYVGALTVGLWAFNSIINYYQGNMILGSLCMLCAVMCAYIWGRGLNESR